ncbi:RNA pseudouridylate synthase [Leishmania donovani]|uniref:RNA pseudouridylate synthase family protein n=2 Tax=Leishmania donovani TaxID=5661 RepID=A0A504XHX0_LEIDO|nr:RNA pseudouridylate synthase family protein [Leishmania donovani]CAJ1990938.1 RNA pseudouridylate synthase [Leishmania donovani]
MNGKDAVVSAASLDALDVIYENAEMLVLSKPPGIRMDGDETIYGRTVESLVCEHMKARGIFDDTHEQLQKEKKRKKQLKFVHQLDFGTSGVLCLAFTKDMAARLAHCFEMRTVRKYYVALLHGHLPSDTAPTEDGASSDQPGSTFTSDTKARRSSFAAWANACNKAWEGLGCVRAVCSASTSGESSANSAGGDEVAGFRYLLQRPRKTAWEAVGLANSKDAEEGVPVTVVHRYHSRRSGAPSLSTSAPENPASVPADVVEDLIYRTLLESTATRSVVFVDLPVGYDLTGPEHLRMAVTAEQSRDAKTSLLVLKRTYLAEPPPAGGEAPQRDAIAKDSPSVTSYPVTLVLLAPHTGRRHQLRVHCRAIGFPIVGDTSYCADLPWCAALPLGSSTSTWAAAGARRMYLHAWRLLLPGTVTPRLDEVERVALKKKRRREILGLSGQHDASFSASRCEWTEFVASVDFTGLDLEDSEDREM